MTSSIVVDEINLALRRVEKKADGPALQARFHGGGPYQVVCSRKYGFVLAKSADEDTLRIIRDGQMMTFGFTGGNAKVWEGPIRSLHGGYVTPIGEDAEGNLYVATNQVIRKVSK